MVDLTTRDVYMVRPKKKNCSFPITLPTLFFGPYPKVFKGKLEIYAKKRRRLYVVRDVFRVL